MTTADTAGIRAVLFDMDGTLADTFPVIIDAWNATTEKAIGRTYTPEEVIALFGTPEHDMLEKALAGLEPERIAQSIETFHRFYEELHGEIQPFPGVDDLLNELHSRGVRMGIVTGKGKRTCALTIRAFGWTDYFGSVITGDDVTLQKPHPESPLKAAGELGIESAECAFAGDNPLDIQAGKAAGMVSIAAAWHPVYEQALRDAQPDFLAETPADILNLPGLPVIR